MSEDARSMELSAADYMTADGVEKLLEFIRKRLNIRDLDLETEAFDKYFNNMTRQRGETLHKYIHAEDSPQKKFQLPKRLIQWHPKHDPRSQHRQTQKGNDRIVSRQSPQRN